MDVKHSLPGGPACVDDDAIARGADILLLGNVLSDEEQMAGEGFVLGPEVAQTADMLDRHDEHVNRRARGASMPAAIATA